MFTEDFTKNRMNRRTKFPNAQERLGDSNLDFQYEENYKENALEQITELLKTTKNIGGVCATLKTKKNAKLYFYVKKSINR